MSTTVKTLALVVLIGLAGAVVSPAGAWLRPPVDGPLVEVDWQNPQSLPKRFRNHCAFDVTHDRSYCSDHCGRDYELYYCSRASFGCCRVGFGYCDWSGLLRCAP